MLILFILSSDYHHYADLSECIELTKYRCILSSVCIRLFQFSQVSFMQNMDLCEAYSLLFWLMCWIHVLCLIIIFKSEVWFIGHCLGFGHEIVWLAMFLWLWYFIPGSNRFFLGSLRFIPASILVAETPPPPSSRNTRFNTIMCYLFALRLTCGLRLCDLANWFVLFTDTLHHIIQSMRYLFDFNQSIYNSVWIHVVNLFLSHNFTLDTHLAWYQQHPSNHE